MIWLSSSSRKGVNTIDANGVSSLLDNLKLRQLTTQPYQELDLVHSFTFIFDDVLNIFERTYVCLVFSQQTKFPYDTFT